MRFLHTSDWHLGQTLHNYERAYEHQCFLDWLLDTIAAEEAEGLLISGDIFDNANPSSASQKQFYRFLQQAKARNPHLNMIIIAGNHDSPGRLEAPGPLLEAQDTAVVGHITRDSLGQIDLERLVLPLKNRAGEIAAWCLAIPFLRPGDVPRSADAADATDAPESADSAQTDSYMEGIALLYRQTLQLALAKRQPGQAIIALGHCHMVDGQVSQESERRIVIGGSEALSSGIFDPAIAYVALGHLHLAQKVGKQGHIRYPGSPLPMSFAEIDYQHQILRIDLAGAAVKEISAIPVPRPVQLLRVPAQPAPISEVLAALASLTGGDLLSGKPLREPAAGQAPPPYLEVRVRIDAPEPGLRARIEAALEGKSVRLAKIETTVIRMQQNALPISLDALERLQPDDIFQRLYQQKYGSATPADQLSAFAELMLAPATVAIESDEP